jgi:ABC-type Na+ transport system ATPase subunit NatA
LSSHLVSDLERVCDYLIVLVASRIVLAGDFGELMASYRPRSLEDLVLSHLGASA